jgi:large subunit ribosomal protein L17
VRHTNQYRKLNRPTDQRLQMLSDLTVALFKHGKIRTTLNRAKETRRLADRFVSLAREGTVAARRRLYAYVKNRTLVKSICEKSLSRFEGRTSGFTRMVRIGSRRGDGAPLVMLELI